MVRYECFGHYARWRHVFFPSKQVWVCVREWKNVYEMRMDKSDNIHLFHSTNFWTPHAMVNVKPNKTNVCDQILMCYKYRNGTNKKKRSTLFKYIKLLETEKIPYYIRLTYVLCVIMKFNLIAKEKVQATENCASMMESHVVWITCLVNKQQYRDFLHLFLSLSLCDHFERDPQRERASVSFNNCEKWQKPAAITLCWLRYAKRMIKN